MKRLSAQLFRPAGTFAIYSVSAGHYNDQSEVHLDQFNHELFKRRTTQPPIPPTKTTISARRPLHPTVIIVVVTFSLVLSRPKPPLPSTTNATT
jgi:hypothetical protein